MPRRSRAILGVIVAALAVLGAAALTRGSLPPWGGPTPATVTSVFPRAESPNVAAGAWVTASFDSPLDAVADQLRFVLTASSGQEVPCAVQFNEDLTAVVLEPLDPLAEGTYTASVKAPGELIGEEWSFTVPSTPPLSAGPGGPVLLVTSEDNAYDEFYAEILRAEGLPGFTTVAAGDFGPEDLTGHRVVLVSGDSVAPGTLPALREWVMAGGSLVVFEPSDTLAGLTGLTEKPDRVAEGDLHLDTAARLTRGLTREPLRVHATSQVVSSDDDVEVLARVSRAGRRGGTPAVTLRPVGPAGGSVAAFTFDLARSVVLTRQGNPKWAGQERDGRLPIRTNDLFVDGSDSDPPDNDSPDDFLDLTRVQVPQADEQMRILSNLLVDTTSDTAPMPRWWYFPRDAKAVLVMAADDHGTEDGTSASFQRLLDTDTPGCRAELWECSRATSWLYPSSGLTDPKAADFVADGFDLGVHPTTHCQNWSEDSLDRSFARSLRAFRRAFPSLPPQHASRLHCIVWSDYLTQPLIERSWGIRLDMNYYYWPGDWVRGRSGFMTGSGLPMRFSDLDGGLIDVYQQETHLVDEVFAGKPEQVAALLDRAHGPEQYFGAFGTHYDFSTDFDVELTRIAEERDVPLVSAQQLLDWEDGRTASRFVDLTPNETGLTFTVEADPHAHDMLRAMLPVEALGAELTDVRRDGEVVDHVVRDIKGIEYAFFDAPSGDYAVSYSPAHSEKTG